jgi:membrane-associated protease RseP (regulator of RpoE activity)
MAMASSVHRVVLSSTDRIEVIQPVSESNSVVESNSALRSFTQASAGAVFSLEDVKRLRSKDQKGEFFIVVVGDNQNKYFKAKARFFSQLFGHTSTQYEEAKAVVPEASGQKPASRNTLGVNRVEAAPPVSVTAKVPEASSVRADSAFGFSVSSSALNSGSQTVSPQSQNGAILLGLAVTAWEQGGVQIVKIAPDSAADLAGLHVGDVVKSVDGKRVRSAADLAAVLANRHPGSQVRLNYMFHTNLGWMPGAEKVLTLDGESN